MKILIFFLLITFLVCSRSTAQYDFIIDDLKIKSTSIPKLINGYFYLRNENQNGKDIKYYDFSSADYDFCYYPKQQGLNCGYFVVNGIPIIIEGKYPFDLGCDLDYGSFELFNITVNTKKYLALICIRYGSGSTTKNVYCNLFDVSMKGEVAFLPLWSLYGSGKCFGDFNSDGIIDFLEIRYDANSKDNNIFRVNLLTLNDIGLMQKTNSYLTFRREYSNDGTIQVKVIERSW